MSRSMFLALLLLAGCQGSPADEAAASAAADTPMPDFQPAQLRGSAQTPDPVLQRVRELERAGSVREVVVLESYPVQIHLEGTAQALAELERIPRVDSNR